MAEVKPFSYCPGNTLLHRSPALLKLSILFLLSISTFTSIYGLIVSSIIILVSSFIARINPKKLLCGCRLLLLISLFIIIFRGLNISFIPLMASINKEGLISGTRQGLCILVSFAAGNLLFSVTTMQELRDSLDNILPSRLNIFSLGLTLMLGFIPRFFQIWEMVNLAYQARGGKKGLISLFFTIPYCTERMITSAVETASALESRSGQ